MSFRHSLLLTSALAWLGMVPVQASAQAPAAGDDLESLQEKAMKAAVLKVAPCVVQIETSGGTDLIGTGPQGPQIRKGIGPTTGLIVASEGYIISSAFNFANKPQFIVVAVPGRKDRFPAKVVANDETRMLTLLKIEGAGNLPVPAATPRKDIKVGQWSLALGRTWSGPENPPSVSVGIISALDRIWGKAVQTDAKVSPVNYGGPLVDIHGKVQGILVPASPRAQDDTAGVEWYDGGIGFAIPLEDVNAVLPRMIQGQNLRRGLVGITPRQVPGVDVFNAPPVVDTVAPDSAADKAGMKPGDLIIEVDGAPVVRHAQVLHLLGRKYEGDKASLKIRRGKEEINFPNLTLTGAVTAYVHPFLGIVPMRDDPELGVEVRYIYPKSPADTAGIKEGDRILTIGRGKETPKPFQGKEGLAAALNAYQPGMEVTVEVRRKETKDLSTLTLKLGPMPETIPDQLPKDATLKKALAPKKAVDPKAPMPPMPAKKEEKKEAKKPETGFFYRTNAAGDHQYWVYVPENYDPNISHALVVWLHPAGKSTEKDAKAMARNWEDDCFDHHIILVGPKAENDTGWLRNEAGFVLEVIRDMLGTYTIDHQRVVAHGWGAGGQLAYYLGFHARDLVRGVAVTGAVLTGQVADNVANQRLAFFVVAGGKDPLAKAIGEAKGKLADKKMPVIYREIPDMGSQYPTETVLAELVRWIDSLDRL